MAEATYAVCAVVSVACAVLLHRGRRDSGHPLLLWASVCFWLLAANNLLLFVDLVLLEDSSLVTARRLTAFAAPMVFLVGLFWSEGG